MKQSGISQFTDAVIICCLAWVIIAPILLIVFSL